MSPFHSQPIDILLHDLLRNGFPGPAEEALTNAKRLADNHPLKRQAFIVLDALESVTNGMENPEVYEFLASIPEDSSLTPWKLLVYALKAYYRGDYGEMAERLEAIVEASPPKALSRLLLHLAGLRDAEKALGRVEREIAKALRGESSPVTEAIAQVNEALEADNEAAFSDSVAFLIKELYGSNPDTSKSLALWALELLAEREMNRLILQEHLFLIFGEAEAQRMISLSLINRNPEEALAFWVKYLLTVLAGPSQKRADIAALAEIGLGLLDRLPGLSAGRAQILAAAAEEVLLLAERAFPGFAVPEGSAKGLREILSTLESLAEAEVKVSKRPAEFSVSRTRKPAASPVQLDLFQ